MIIKLATCLLAISVLTACETTSTASHETLEQRMLASTTGTTGSNVGEPAPPAEGPEDIPAEGPVDPLRNPGLLPTPLLRANAAGGL